MVRGKVYPCVRQTRGAGAGDDEEQVEEERAITGARGARDRLLKKKWRGKKYHHNQFLTAESFATSHAYKEITFATSHTSKGLPRFE